MNARLAIGALVALAAVGAVAAAIVLGLGSGTTEAAPRELDSGEPIAIVTTLSPAVHRLGDLVVARLELTVDPQIVDPGRIDVRAQFAPYEPAREVQVSRRSAAGRSVVEYTYWLQCLASDCVREESPAQIELPQALVSYLRSDTNRGVNRPTSWPTATLVVRAGDGAGSVPAEATLGALPEATYAISPNLLRGLAIGLAALLVAAASAWALYLLRPRWKVGGPASEPASESDGLSCALAQLVEARDQSVNAQRLALHELASELESPHTQQLAPLARRLAWSSVSPERTEVDALLAAATKLEEHA